MYIKYLITSKEKERHWEIRQKYNTFSLSSFVLIFYIHLHTGDLMRVWRVSKTRGSNQSYPYMLWCKTKVLFEE